jgi:hypothetical protein
VTLHGEQTCFVGSFSGELDYGGTTPFSGDAFTPLICFIP